MRAIFSTLLAACTLTACVSGVAIGPKATKSPAVKTTTVGDCSGATPPEPQPLGTVAIEVHTPDGKPAAGAQVKVTPKPKGYHVACAPAVMPVAGFNNPTDEHGKTGQANQAYGSYLVTAQLGGQQASGELTLDADHPSASLVLTLAAGTTASLLRAPTEAANQLSGVVNIDAAYTLAHGGSLISDHGGGVLQLSPLLSDQGSGIVANNSGNLVANNGGALIANNGGGLTGKTKRGLLAAPAAGATLPAAGMLVHATSLRTHEPLPVGVDDAGKPVYAVYTNLTGGFTVYVPASEQGNVLLTAEAPDQPDARLRYAVVTSAKATAAQAIDEDTAVVARYIRQGLIGRMRDMLTQDPAETLCLLDAYGSLSPVVKNLFAATVTEMREAGKAAGIRTEDRDQVAVWAMAARCADLIIAEVPLETITLDTKGNVDWGSQPNEGPEPALSAMGDVIAAMRDATAAKLAKDAHAFDQAPYLLAANACAPGRYQFLKGADAGAFMIDEYLSRTGKDTSKDAGLLIQALGVDTDAKGVSRSRRVKAAINSVGQALSQGFVLDTNGVRARMQDLVKSYQPVYTPIPGEPPPVVLPESCLHRESCKQ